MSESTFARRCPACLLLSQRTLIQSEDDCAPAPDVLPLEFSFLVRPTGRLIMLGQVPCIEPFRTLSPDTRLWMRWFERDRDDAQIEIAVSDADNEAVSCARVLARACVPERRGAWALFRVAQAQGVVDLALAGPTTAGEACSTDEWATVAGAHKVGGRVARLVSMAIR